MEIKKATVNGLKHTYQVTVKPETVELRVKNRLLEVGKTAKVSGFRPGKIPMQILQQRYEGSVRPEVVRALIDEAYQMILTEKKLRPASQPSITVDSYDVDKALECTYEVETLPEIKEIDLTKLKVEKLVAGVEDKTVDETITKIAESNKTTEPLKKARAAKKGDTVIIDFDGRTKKGPITGGSGKGVNLELGSGYFIPGFEEQLEGAKKGDAKTVNVAFPKDYSAKDLAGEDATFEVTVQDIHSTVVPKVDDAFCEKIGFKDLKDLKEAIKAQLQAENDKLSFFVAKRTILDSLDKEKIELPEGLVENELNQLKASDDAAPEASADADGKKEKETKKKESAEDKKMRTLAERRVRLGLVLAEIGNKNKVEVTQKELQHAMIEQARRFPGEEQKVMEYFQQNQDAQQSLRAPIFEDKVISAVLDKASVKEKKVTQKVLEEAAKKAGEAEA